MAVTRADTLTQTGRKAEIFSDFFDSFAASPVNGTLAKVTNEDSVRQSIKNLVLTNLGERFFQPNLGTNVNRALFEMNDILNALNLKTYIQNTIKYYEPRANDISVEVIPTDDQQYLAINILFYVINNPSPINLSLNLKRVR